MPKLTASERFDAKWKLDPDTGCHLWTHGLDSHGYSAFKIDGRQIGGHIYAYVRKYGPVPANRVLDHFRCDTKHCVNPDHVRPATNRENSLRGNDGPCAVNSRKTHCVHGHEFTPENTYVPPGTTKRRCVRCKSDEAKRNQKARTRRRRAIH